MSKASQIKLNSGTMMPVFGFGTWQLSEGWETKESVKHALNTGYRLIDTARIYGNETSVGQAIKNSGIKRDEIFVTTKLWTSDFQHAEEAFKASLQRLDMGFVDLYLIHWPNGSSRREAWKILTKLYEDKKAKSVGVSNYMVEHLKELPQYSDLTPAVNQIEFHPFIYKEQKPVLDLCREKGIVVEAYSPLAQGRARHNQTIADIADSHNKSPAQVMLRWAIQHRTVPIPRSSNPEHIKSNFEVFDFELTKENMAALNNLS
jgi:methylglyoxal/glyoxal reductase